ncbi:MAG: MFS transporter [Thermoplasmata archaeon]|nr:MFS transporter [Thermoplasmata archaeon]
MGLNASTSQLGLVLGIYLLGVGLFQIPGGMAALRWGARPVALAGLCVMGVFGALSALSPDWQILAAARFATGAGAAFFFAPGLSLVASYYPHEQRAPIIGLYNGGFSLGGAIGLFGGALLGTVIGWQWTLGAGGLVLLGVAGFGAWILPLEPVRQVVGTFTEIQRAAARVLRSRSLWAISLALAGLWASMYIIAQYFVQYGAEVHPDWGIGITAAIAALVVVAAFPGGVAGGWLAKGSRRHRFLLILCTATIGVVIATIPFLPLYAVAALFIYVGFADGVAVAVLYFIPTYMPDTGGEHLVLGIASLNTIQVFVGSALAIAFGYLAEYGSYALAWIFAGAITIGFLPLLFYAYLGTAHHAHLDATAPRA